jgi:hypothetical protein
VRVLTVHESAGWLTARGLRMVPAARSGSDHHLPLPEDYESTYFGTPQDAKTVASLAHLLAEAYDWQGSVLLICVVAHYEQHELDAFRFIRRLYGDDRWADGVPGGATPGQWFCDGGAWDTRNVRELMGLMMAYAFEGYFVREDGQTVVWVGDDVVEILSRRPEDLQRARKIVSTLGLGETDWARELIVRRRTRR